MDGTRIQEALARIEAASQRIEAAAVRPPGASVGDPDLQRRHDALKHESSSALRDIERLIERLDA